MWEKNNLSQKKIVYIYIKDVSFQLLKQSHYRMQNMWGVTLSNKVMGRNKYIFNSSEANLNCRIHCFSFIEKCWDWKHAHTHTFQFRKDVFELTAEIFAMDRVPGRDTSQYCKQVGRISLKDRPVLVVVWCYFSKVREPKSAA